MIGSRLAPGRNGDSTSGSKGGVTQEREAQMVVMEAFEQREAGRLAPLALPKAISLSAFLVPVAIMAGSYYPRFVAFFDQHVAIIDTWNTKDSVWKWVLIVVLLVLTVAMFMKQWSYYYRLGQGKSGFFVDTCGCFNDVEWNLDLVMSFWGGLLFLSAVRMPGYWLPFSAGYSALVYTRCDVSLKRNSYATSWSGKGEDAGPRYWSFISTFPWAQTITVARDAGFLASETPDDWTSRLGLMGKSLTWTHPTAVYRDNGTSRQLMACEILAGWAWSHRLFCRLGVVFSIISFVVLARTGPGATACITTILLCLAQVYLFRSLSKASELWGVRWVAETSRATKTQNIP
jgi:hypothetical protein